MALRYNTCLLLCQRRSNTFFLAASGLFGSIFADIVKHCLFERVLKVAFFQAVLFVYDMAELLDQVVVNFSIYDCQVTVKLVSKQDTYKDVPLTC